MVAATAMPRGVHAQAKHKLRYISFAGKTSAWSQPYFELARQVEQRSGGEMQVDWAGGPEVVGPMQAGDAIAKGVFDLAHQANSYYAAAVPEAIVMSSGKASHAAIHDSGLFNVLDEIHQAKLGAILLGIATCGVGFIFLCREQPTNLAYFKGKKFRSLAIFDPIFNNLGASPVTLAPTEAYVALERGVVDGMAWPELTIKEYGFFERAKYMMRPSFYTSRTVTLLSQSAYQKLPPQLQVVLRDSARAAGEWGEKYFRDAAATELAEMKQKGLQEISLSQGDAKSFIQLSQDVLWKRVHEVSPPNAPRLQALFDKAEAMS